MELCACLVSSDFNGVQTAIGCYEEAMRARASEVTAMTLEQTRALHAQDSLDYMVALFG
jgi:hypothetical protein